MTATYYAILTNVGAAKLANAQALGATLKITQMAVGDGGGIVPTPTATRTALIGQQRIAPLNQLSVDKANSSQIIAEQVLPETVGGWWIRELGLFDSAGDLVAYANCPPSYKPQLAEGSGRTQTIRMVLIVSNVASLELKIDPSVVLATRQYVDDTIVVATAQATEMLRGTARIAADVDLAAGVDDTKITTPKKLATWFASVMKQATEAASGWARIATQTQANSGADDTTIITPKKLTGALSALIIQATESVTGIAKVATQAQANAGTDDATIVTPKKLTGALSALVIQATEAIRGIAKVATQDQTNAGTDDATFVTPKKLRFGFSLSLAATGYVAFPSWLGGLIVQWGTAIGVGQATNSSGVAGPARTVTLPLTFPNELLATFASMRFNTMTTSSAFAPGAIGLSNSQISVQNNYTNSPGDISWLAIGR